MLKLAHKNLDVWNFSKQLVAEIYRLTSSFPKEELFGLTNQLRRASISVISNIAEGSARKGSTERKRFYEISRSSIVEIDTQIEVSLALGLLKKDDVEKLDEIINHLFAMISKMIIKQPST